MTETIAYCSGVIDGEGHVAVINMSKYGYHYPTPQIAVQMTDFEVIHFLHKTFGRGSVCYPSQQKSHHKPTARWSVTSRNAYVVARMIRPYALAKRSGVEAILAHYDAFSPEGKPDRYVRGENHHASKLTGEKVLELLSLRDQPRTYGDVKKIVAKYGIAESTLRSIWSGKTWKICNQPHEDVI